MEVISKQGFFQIFVFNITNHDAWLAGAGKVKLKVEEIGPIVYRYVYMIEYSCILLFRETWWRTNIVVQDDGEVRYDLVKRFILLPSQSTVSPEAMVIIPNIPLFSGAARMKGEDSITSWGFQVLSIG